MNVASPLSLHWLAGILEAEGSFMNGPPSAPNLPLVTCSMTDRDTIDRVAAMFGTATIEIDKSPYRMEYRTAAKGARAVALMGDLRTMMGVRRRQAIDVALAHHVLPPPRKLNFELAERIRSRYRAGATVSALARDHNVRRSTIRQLLRGEFYRQQRAVVYPWREPARRRRELSPSAAIRTPAVPHHGDVPRYRRHHPRRR